MEAGPGAIRSRPLVLLLCLLGVPRYTQLSRRAAGVSRPVLTLDRPAQAWRSSLPLLSSGTAMLASVRAMFSGIVDYAGMFPPAQLPLEQAIRNYALYRTEPESWMLGRFVCPAAQLHELSPFVEELFREAPPLAVSVLGRGGKSGSDFLVDLRADLECVALLCQRHGQQIKIDTFETRVTPELMPDLDSLSYTGDCLYEAGRAIDAIGLPNIQLFLEPSLEGNWVESVDKLFVALFAGNVLARKRISNRLRCPWFGLKLRLGGTQASAFPSAGQLSYALCSLEGYPFKATAGLHHPLRCFDPTLDTYMHGFLNVWIGTLASRLDAVKFDKVMMPLLLEEENPSNFVFDEQGAGWRDVKISTKLIAEGRTKITSFGSCSFDEPRDGLRALGLIP
jgi:hypothetical protein